jgi:thiol-disulfide isomerase/thioredoxin
MVRRFRTLKLLVAALVTTLAVLGLALYLSGQRLTEVGNTPSTARLQGFAHGNLQRLTPLDPAFPAPDQPFFAPDGAEIRLTDFKGQVLVVNFWATWCAPCRVEMPSLNRLAAKLDKDPARVLTISLDRGGAAVAQKFLDEIKADRLTAYVDQGSALAGQLQVTGLPATLIIDRNGYIVARHDGPAEWDQPDAVALVREVMASPGE